MNILVPLDFSARSANALEYAAAMATANDGEIYLVHVLSSDLTNEHSESKQRANVFRELHALQKNVENAFGIRSKLEMLRGNVSEEILRVANTVRPDLIVMASRGVSTLSSALLGSNTAKVMDGSVIPVLAVPWGARYTRPTRIVFGTENEDSDIAKLKGLIAFANLDGARIEVVHVVNRFAEGEDESDVRNVERFRADLRRSISYPFIRCEEYQHTDIAEGILCFVEEQHADLLVLPSNYLPLVERLVRGNLNNEYAYQLEVPLLCLHDN